MLWREMWAGADVSPESWLVYTGATVAPYSQIHDDGLRLRAATGYGAYSYRYDSNGRTFSANTMFGEALVGYLKRFDPLTVKLFAGLSYIEHDIHPWDDHSISNGAEWGIKGVAELWLNMGDNAWGSLDVSYSTAHDTAALRLRAGYRITPEISIGLEGGFNVDGQAECKMRLGLIDHCADTPAGEEVKSLLDYGRAGIFGRYQWEGGEISVSAGAIGRLYAPDDTVDFNPYGIVNWITQF